MALRVSVLQHSDGAPPGTVSEWIRLRSHQQDLRTLHKGAKLPSLSETDLVIVLGGPMNVDDTTEHPWLTSEKSFLEAVIAKNIACIGLCLGGQLLAQVLGAKVEKSPQWEVGWHPIEFKDKSELIVFQWHQDMFGLPAGAERVATNSLTSNQAFRFGNNIFATQFHPEATAEWVQECADDEDYPTGTFVQSPLELMNGVYHLKKMRAWFFGQLDQLAANVR